MDLATHVAVGSGPWDFTRKAGVALDDPMRAGPLSSKRVYAVPGLDYCRNQPKILVTIKR
jgi:hypothetical protein